MLGGLRNDSKDRGPKRASEYFTSSSTDDCIVQVGAVLKQGDAVMPLETVPDRDRGYGLLVLYTTPDAAKTTVMTLDAAMISCRGGAMTATGSEPKQSPAWYTYDGRLSAEIPVAQLIVVQYGNTVTLSSSGSPMAAAPYAAELKKRVDALVR